MENKAILNGTVSSSAVAIAITGSKKSKYLMKWAFENLIPQGDPPQIRFKLLHVFPEIRIVPTPLGSGIPISQVRDDIAATFRKEVESQISEKLLVYKNACIRRKVQVEIVQIESDDIANEIAKEIRKRNINKLVIGASSTGGVFSSSYWMPVGQNLTAKISECCPSFCTVYVVSKGKLSSVRPSDPEAIVSNVDETSDTEKFGNFSPNNSRNSQSEWLEESLSTSYSRFLPPPSAIKQSPFITNTNQSLIESRTNSSDFRSLSDFIAEGEEDGVSSSSSSEVNDVRVKGSSFRSLILDNHSTSNDFPFGSQVNMNFELQQLRMDLRHVKGMFAKAQNEAIEASEKLNDLHQQRLDETVKLKHMSFKEEAIELAEKSKAEYKATKREEAKYAEEFSWEEITLATLSFSNDVRIGMGFYGTVYKCTLRHMNVAVKILHSMEANGIEQFHLEIEILSKIRHPNLVTLLGACPDRGCLIYEYMENGSLDDRLFRKNNTPPIPRFERYKIAHEIASALLFLHNSKPKPIIHRHLKPSNILLDQNYVTKIGDVGLSTMLHSDMYNTTTSYTDPEYQRTGVVSTKSDVYAFGMVVLQLLTAKPAIALASLMETAIGDDRLARVLDVEAGDWPIEETMELAVLALKCTELRGRDRPDLINEIVPALEKLRMVSDKPRDLASFGPTSPPPPTHFICPIQKDVMNEPCVAADGYTYDRKAIVKWFEQNNRSPVTNLPLQNMSLIPNYTLLSAIKDWKYGKS